MQDFNKDFLYPLIYFDLIIIILKKNSSIFMLVYPCICDGDDVAVAYSCYPCIVFIFDM